MTRRLLLAPRVALLALAASSVALAPGLVGPTPLVRAGVAVAATGGTLSVSPNRYVAGQAVRFRGNLGVTGARSVHLQAKGNRPGDTWGDVPDSTFRTDYTRTLRLRLPRPLDGQHELPRCRWWAGDQPLPVQGQPPGAHAHPGRRQPGLPVLPGPSPAHGSPSSSTPLPRSVASGALRRRSPGGRSCSSSASTPIGGRRSAAGD